MSSLDSKRKMIDPTQFFALYGNTNREHTGSPASHSMKMPNIRSLQLPSRSNIVPLPTCYEYGDDDHSGHGKPTPNDMRSPSITTMTVKPANTLHPNTANKRNANRPPPIRHYNESSKQGLGTGTAPPPHATPWSEEKTSSSLRLIPLNTFTITIYGKEDRNGKRIKMNRCSTNPLIRWSNRECNGAVVRNGYRTSRPEQFVF